MSAVVRDAAQDGEAGHQHRVVVVAEAAVLAEADQRVEAAQGEQLSAHRGVRAESGEIFRLEMLRQNNMIIIVMNNGLQNPGPTAILSLMIGGHDGRNETRADIRAVNYMLKRDIKID